VTDPQLAMVGLAAATVASGLMVLAPDWRLVAIGLWLGYGALALVVGTSLVFSAGLVKLVGGSLAVGVLWLASRPIRPSGPRPGGLVGRLGFRVIAFLLVWLSAWSLGRMEWLSLAGLSAVARAVGAMLLTMGLCQVGLFQHPFRVGIGLLATVAGFEAVYAPLEPSLAVAAMMVAVQLGLALAAGYLASRWAWEPPGQPVTERRR